MLNGKIKPIETPYAGCKFRSRLEARWAVFFDAIGMKWEYEPQTVEVSYRLSSFGNESFLYVPDFWLPDLELWAEVKGNFDDDELLRFLNAAASLSSNNGGGCHDRGGNDVVILGTPQCRPETGEYRRPWRLHMHKGGLYAAPWNLNMPGTGCLDEWWGTEWEVAQDFGGDLADITSSCERSDDLRGDLLAGHQEWTDGPVGHMCHGLRAARSARFEHGESG